MTPPTVDLAALEESGEFANTLVFNGINADTGEYQFPQMEVDTLARRIRDEPANPYLDASLKEKKAQTEKHLGVVFGRDPEKLDSVGWALVAADDVDPEVLEALAPLRDHRRRQAGDLYTELCSPESGVRNSETAQDYLLRHHVAPLDIADPRELPYYVTLVGNPESIPFEFQYELGVQRAVGRLDFDTPDQYAQYAHNVVAAETASAAGVERRAHVFAARNDFDMATALSARFLADPLVTELGNGPVQVDVSKDIGETATKHRLDEVLRGPRLDVLFTATHGLATSSSLQRERQGALLCQDWRGRLGGSAGPIDPVCYYSAADVPTGGAIGPTVIFSFACFGAGTPGVTDFADEPEPAASAGRPFVARLPQRLLANTGGGCLGFVGHIDRVWNSSFLWKGIEPQILPFTSAIRALLSGCPLGMALEYVSQRHATIATQLTSLLGQIRRATKRVSDHELARMWLADHDARNFLILGDPAITVGKSVAVPGVNER
jgi:hypothetical protein